MKDRMSEKASDGQISPMEQSIKSSGDKNHLKTKKMFSKT
jgi:hypothetical protein